MKGKISLKDFILGVKQELVTAAKEGSKEPFFELKEVELKAQFSLEIAGEVEAGGLGLFLKLTGKAKSEQLHEVVLKFSPLSLDEPMAGLPGKPNLFPKPVMRSSQRVMMVEMPEKKTRGPRMEKDVKLTGEVKAKRSSLPKSKSTKFK